MTQISSNIYQSDAGIYIGNAGLYLDPQKPVTHAVVSHAHADHYVNGHTNVYCTPATYALLKQRYGKQLTGQFIVNDYHASFLVNGFAVRFLSAGHMLGSAQVMVEDGMRKILYTGDFKLQADATCMPYEFAKADLLITETTFAMPSAVHPDPIAEMEKIASRSNIKIALGVYVMGKAQRICSLLEAYCPGRLVLIHSSIVPYHKVYASFNVNFANCYNYTRPLFRKSSNCVYLMPPAYFKYYPTHYTLHKAFVSGWQHLTNGNNFGLRISDHADWNDLLQVIEFTQPKEIITIHGNGNHLSGYASKRNIKLVVT